MRYRPLGGTGTVVSAVSVALTDAPNHRRADDWRDIVIAGLEAGVNAFEIVGANPAILEGLGEALRTVDRHLIFVSLRLGGSEGQSRDFSAGYLARTVEGTIAHTGLNHIDLCMLDDPGEDELSGEAMTTLKALRTAGRTRLIGVGGRGTAMDAYISMGGFDAIALPYNLACGWTERLRLKAAAERDMAVIGYDFWPDQFHQPEPAKLSSAVKRLFLGKPKTEEALGAMGTYAFLHDTPGWSAEDICLAYALTEPSIATVQIPMASMDHLTQLAQVTEREMPSGVASRIEMARFGGQKAAGQG